MAKNRTIEFLSTRRVGLCLVGGGGAGVTQAGMLFALKEYFQDCLIDAMAGVSVGSLNLALAAQWDFELMKDLWIHMKRWHVFGVCKALLPFSSSYFSTGPLKRLIDEHVSIEAVERSDMDLFVQACDRDTGEPVVWKKGDPDLENMLLASSAIPVVFPQVWSQRRDCWLVDGGVIDNSPLDLLIGKNGPPPCDVIFVLHCHTNRQPRMQEKKLTRMEMLAKLTSLVWVANQKHDTRSVQWYNKFICAGMKMGSVIHVVDVFPKFIDVGTLEFGDKEKARSAFNDGYYSMKAVLTETVLRGAETAPNKYEKGVDPV